MTESEVAVTLGVIGEHWGGSQLGDLRAAVRTWHAVLGRFEAVDVQAAVERLLNREFAPRAGQVAAEVQSALQGDPPPFEQLGVEVERAQHWLPYNPHGSYSPQDTARAVAVLQARGVHEATLRMVASAGIGAVFAIPWGDRNPADLGQSADRRDMARSYQHGAVARWQRDPRPGVALSQACIAAQVDEQALLAEASAEQAAHRAELGARRERVLLPAPAGAEGELVDLDAAMLVLRRRNVQAEAARAAERERAQRAEGDAYRAAQAELAAHPRLSTEVPSHGC